MRRITLVVEFKDGSKSAFSKTTPRARAIEMAELLISRGAVRVTLSAGRWHRTFKKGAGVAELGGSPPLRRNINRAEPPKKEG